MIQQILLPKLGETMTEATIEKWHKREGDAIKKGEVILEITTDKATLEVEATVAGILRKVLAPEKATLPVNAVIALAGEANDPLPANLNDLLAAAQSGQAAAPAAETKKAEDAPAAAADAPATSAAPTGERFASPRARAKARGEKVPLSILQGSGPNGRIVEKDVLAYLRRRDQVKATPVAIEIALERGLDLTQVKGTGPAGKITKEDALAAKVAAAPAAKAVKEGRIELSAMRRVVADRMTKSKREAPHFYLTMEIDMTAAAAFRAKLNADLAAEASAKAAGKVRIAFHDLIIRACAKAMKDNPAMNVAWGGDHIRQRGDINISLAVALDEGLIVPVVKNAGALTLAQTAQASARLIEKARSKKLTPDEYEGGCLTISNLGMFDIDSFLPVINPGESGIMGIGRIAQKVVVKDGGIHIRSILTATLSADHRAVDGAIAAKFFKRVKELLETPESLV